eukprot:1142975-Pelagomonas_calceolata.AAC.2
MAPPELGFHSDTRWREWQSMRRTPDAVTYKALEARVMVFPFRHSHHLESAGGAAASEAHPGGSDLQGRVDEDHWSLAPTRHSRCRQFENTPCRTTANPEGSTTVLDPVAMDAAHPISKFLQGKAGDSN